MWIELHDSARDHPKVIKLARDLGVHQVQALGHMCSLWTWTLRMAPDGDLGSFDHEDIEIGAMWEGEPGAFVAAAVGRGLLDDHDGNVTVHDWDEFAGSLKAAQRVRVHRQRKRTLQSHDETLPQRTVTLCNAERPTDRPTDRNDRTIQSLDGNVAPTLEQIGAEEGWGDPPPSLLDMRPIPPEVIDKALNKTRKAGTPGWGYFAGVVRGENGRAKPKPPKPKPKASPPKEEPGFEGPPKGLVDQVVNSCRMDEDKDQT